MGFTSEIPSGIDDSHLNIGILIELRPVPLYLHWATCLPLTNYKPGRH
jgi:hypothetical protein